MIDVTRSVHPGLPAWPGDTAYRYRQVASIAAGDSANIGSIELSVHTGTHVDAPWHYVEGGLKLHEVPLETWVGPCLVVDAPGAARLGPELLDGLDLAGASKVLFRTGQPDRWSDFPRQWAVVDPALPPALAARGVSLLGTDAPSADELESKSLPGHKALAAAGVCILESLALERVRPGRYRLVCLPMALHGTDGAPARAVLEEGT